MSLEPPGETWRQLNLSTISQSYIQDMLHMGMCTSKQYIIIVRVFICNVHNQNESICLFLSFVIPRSFSDNFNNDISQWSVSNGQFHYLLLCSF